MKVDTLDNNTWSAGTTQRQPDQVLQDVFSQVLFEAGRPTYASAEAVSDETPMTEQIFESWSYWFDEARSEGRYRDADAENLKQNYGELLVRAYEEGAYADPEAFLKTLSQDELSTVQKTQYLADFIQVDDLSVEGAMNLLIPPPTQIDMDHDGLTQCGVAYGMGFPDSNTPPEVVKAWNVATEGMDFQERMIHEIQMMLPLLTANLVVDENGQFLDYHKPGDPEFTNPMASPDYSYVQYAKDRLKYTEHFRNHMTPEQYERDKSFWTNFQNQLIAFGAL